MGPCPRTPRGAHPRHAFGARIRPALVCGARRANDPDPQLAPASPPALCYGAHACGRSGARACGFLPPSCMPGLLLAVAASTCRFPLPTTHQRKRKGSAECATGRFTNQTTWLLATSLVLTAFRHLNDLAARPDLLPPQHTKRSTPFLSRVPACSLQMAWSLVLSGDFLLTQPGCSRRWLRMGPAALTLAAGGQAPGEQGACLTCCMPD